MPITKKFKLGDLVKPSNSALPDNWQLSYDYSRKIVTIAELKKEIGEIVKTSDLFCYLVWFPRFNHEWLFNESSLVDANEDYYKNK